MTDSPELQQALDRLKAQGRIRTPDPVQVQGKVDAFLLQRGRHVAHDLDLDHVQDRDLVELGWLDCVAQHPTLPPDLATKLEIIAAEREQGVSTGQDHAPDQGVSMGGGTGGHTPGQVQDVAQDALSITPEPAGSSAPSGHDQGRGDTAARAGPKPDVPFEGQDPITWYLQNVPDPDDDEWSPT